MHQSQKTSLDKYEREILYYVIRHGMKPLVFNDGTEEGEVNPMTVLEYVKFDLERDGLWFQTPLLTDILNEAIAQMSDPNFEPSRYFLAHPKEEISKIAVSLLEDKYQLSKVHTKQFGENAKQEDTPFAEHKLLDTSVPRVLTELKNAHVTIQIKEIKKQMTEKQKEGDMDATMQLMHQLKGLEEIKGMLAKVLGERIVLRW